MASIDVVIPCYRYGRFLKDSVGSVLSTQGCDVRVLILDDASPDETPEVARELQRADPRVAYVRHRANKGHIATYNEGLLGWAKADCSLLLSADDYVTPGALARAAQLMEARPDLGMVYGPFVEVRDDAPLPDLPPADVEAPYQVQDARSFFAINRTMNPIHTSTAVVRTALQQKLGGYLPALTHSGDQEMWLRFALHAPVARIDVAQGVWRNHGNNMSSYYYADMMRDLQQRRAMLDTIFSYPAAATVADLWHDMTLGLAMAAVRSASQPFQHGDAAGARQMMAFGEAINPAVRQTRLWTLQKAKMMLGTRVWQAVRPLAVSVLGLSLDKQIADLQQSRS